MREFEEFWPTGADQQKGDISSKCPLEMSEDIEGAAKQLGMKPAKLIRVALKYFLLEKALEKKIKLKHINADQLTQLKREIQLLTEKR